MTITLDTTPAQDAALAVLNALSNPKNPPAPDVFCASVISDYLDSLGADQKAAAIRQAAAALGRNAAAVSAADVTALAALAAKYPDVTTAAGAGTITP